LTLDWIAALVVGEEGVFGIANTEKDTGFHKLQVVGVLYQHCLFLVILFKDIVFLLSRRATTLVGL